MTLETQNTNTQNAVDDSANGTAPNSVIQSGNVALKSGIQSYWEQETCGTRYADEANRKRYFRDISRMRYRLEPYIPPFADFPSAKGKKMLEIGVGAGSDFENWCRHAAHATGVDLTERAIRLTGERLQLIGVPPDRYTLMQADGENLPFEDDSFDLVYSWGVLLCAPDMKRAYEEVFRVLKPGGELKTMIYHVPSWTGFLLWVQHGLLRGKPQRSLKDVLYHHLESPGTQAFTVPETRELFQNIGFTDLKLSTKLGPADLMTIKPSHKYRSPKMRAVFNLVRAFYPRWLVRLLGDRYGLNLMIQARKPQDA